MKKLLALVLALVMTLGLATVGTNAAYADEKDINYDEAVTVLSTIGILKGDESGFRPGETLKRSEGAKIIAYLLLGNETAEAMVGTGTKFTDVPASHWAAGYIEYLTAQKVISGVGGGKFDPDGTLTTNQFAKMLLVALGFDAGIEGLTGSDWAINTQKLANLASVDLFDGNDDAKGNEAIKREEAALYAFNVLQTPLVTYDSKGTEIAVNGAEIKFAASNWKYETEQVGKNTNAENIYDELTNDSNGNQVDMIEFAEKYYTHLTLVDNGDSCDDLGRPVRKWNWYNAEIGTFAKTNELVKTWTAKVTTKAVYDEIGKSAYDSLYRATWSAGGAGLPPVGTLTKGTELRVFEDGVNKSAASALAHAPNDPLAANGDNESVGWLAGGGTIAANALDAFAHKTNTNKVSNTGNGTVTELYMDKDHNVTLVTYHTYLFQAAGDYNSSTKTLNIVAGDDVETVVLKDYKVKLDDFEQIADYKDGDYLLVTVGKVDNARYEIQSIDKAEIVSGKVTTYDTGDNQTVTLDGTLYKYSKTAQDNLKNTNFSVGQTAKLVLDKYGYVIAVDEALETSDYVFVMDWGSSSSLSADARAKVVFADGTDGEITVKQAYDYVAGKDETSKEKIGYWDTNTAPAADTIPGRNLNKWYTFSKNSSGEYSLYKIEAKYTQTDVNYASAGAAELSVAENNKAKFLTANYKTTAPVATAPAFLADDKTVAITYDGSDYSTYTGVKNMPEILLKTKTGVSTVDAYVLHKDNNYTSLVFFKASGDGVTISGGEGENLVYVINFKTKTNAADSKTWYTYTTLDGTEEVKVQADKRILDPKTDIYSAAFYASKNADGQLTNFREVNAVELGGISKGSVFGAKVVKNAVTYSGSTISVGGQNFTVNSNTKATLVTLKGLDTNSDKAADYEVFTGVGSAGARQVAALLENYTYTYDWAVKCTSKDSMIAEQIFVTVSAVTLATSDDSADLINQFGKIGAAGGTYTPTDGVAVLGAGKTLTLTTPMTIAGDLVIRGTLDKAGFALNVTGMIYNYSSNSLKGGGALTAGGLVNDGTLDVTTVTINSGTVGGVTYTGTGSVEFAGGNAVVTGAVTAAKDVKVSSTGETKLQGGVTATKGNIDIVAAGQVELTGAVTASAGKIVIESGTNDGKIALKNAALSAKTANDVEIAKGTTDASTGTNTISGNAVTTNDVYTETDANGDAVVYGVAADTALIKIAIV